MKIVFLDAATMGKTSFEPITKFGELVTYDFSTAEEALERVADCDVLIVNKVKVTANLMDRATSLRLICEAATGVNNIDIDAAEERGIIVRNVSGYSTDSVAQTTWMHILSLAGKAPYFDSMVKDGTYSRLPIFTDPNESYTELAGKLMGIIGMGVIGSKVARIAEAFGMRVCYFSTSGTGHCKSYPSVPLEQLMKESDVISVHAPYNEKTAGLIGYRELNLMKPSAFIANLGRGGIIVERDLAAAIDEGRIGGAALDVFESEPLASDSPLLHTSHPEKLRFTPHEAWASNEAKDRLIAGIAENIRKGW